MSAAELIRDWHLPLATHSIARPQLLGRDMTIGLTMVCSKSRPRELTLLRAWAGPAAPDVDREDTKQQQE